MQVGRPSMARVDLPEGVVPTHVYVTENADRLYYGLVATADSSLYALECGTYRMLKLPEVKVNPETQRIMIVKSLFSWVVKIADDKEITWIALDSQNGCNFLGKYHYTYPTSNLDKVEKWIFPFTISFTSDYDQHVYPRISNFSWHAIFLNILLAIAVAVILRRRTPGCRIANVVVTLIFGIFAFIPILLIKH